MEKVKWANMGHLPKTDAQAYVCGWCGDKVSSEIGTYTTQAGSTAWLRFCPGCGRPSTIGLDDRQVPGQRYGDTVTDLPADLEGLYNEARDCVGCRATHAAVMVARKVLMHVAVKQGADENKTFAFYVDYLVDKNLVPPNSKDWVDEIREVGNDANHEIPAISPAEAQAVVDFAAMLLKLLYEYPARGQRSVAARTARNGSA